MCCTTGTLVASGGPLSGSTTANFRELRQCELRRRPISGTSATEQSGPKPPPLCTLLGNSSGTRPGLRPLRLLRCALRGILADLSSFQLRHPGGQGGVGLRELRDDGVGTPAGFSLLGQLVLQ